MTPVLDIRPGPLGREFVRIRGYLKRIEDGDHEKYWRVKERY